MAKSKSSKNQSQSNLDAKKLKPLQIDETIESIPRSNNNNLESLLAKIVGNKFPMKVGGLEIVRNDFDLDESNYLTDYDDFETEIENILGTPNIAVNEKNLKKFQKYLNKNLEMPCEVVAMDGYNEDDYKQDMDFKNRGKLSVTVPDEGEEYEMVEVDNYLDNKYGILVEVMRISDRKKLTVPLAQLEVIDPDDESPNYDLLDIYSLWFFSE